MQFIKQADIGQSIGVTIDNSISYDTKSKYRAQYSIPNDDTARIYESEDPIETSLNMRNQHSGGYIQEVLKTRQDPDI